MLNEIFNDCIEACNRCASECEHCAASCLKEDNIQPLTRCIELDLDCSLLCVVTAKLLARGSDQGLTLARQCAEICQLCAAECRKHEMKHCQRCAELCEACAEECEEVAEQRVQVA